MCTMVLLHGWRCIHWNAKQLQVLWKLLKREVKGGKSERQQVYCHYSFHHGVMMDAAGGGRHGTVPTGGSNASMYVTRKWALPDLARGVRRHVMSFSYEYKLRIPAHERGYSPGWIIDRGKHTRGLIRMHVGSNSANQPTNSQWWDATCEQISARSRGNSRIMPNGILVMHRLNQLRKWLFPWWCNWQLEVWAGHELWSTETH